MYCPQSNQFFICYRSLWKYYELVSCLVVVSSLVDDCSSFLLPWLIVSGKFLSALYLDFLFRNHDFLLRCPWERPLNISEILENRTTEKPTNQYGRAMHFWRKHDATGNSNVYGFSSFHGHYSCLKLHKSLNDNMGVIITAFCVGNDYVNFEVFYHQWLKFMIISYYRAPW